MSKIKEASQFTNGAWSTPTPIGADDANIDITSATTNPTDSTATIDGLIAADVTVSSGDTGANAWTKFNRFRKRVANVISQLVQESAFEIVDDNGTLKLYWYGSQAECPYTITYQEGVYKLYYVYTTV